MTKEEFMMEAALKLLSLNCFTASHIVKEVRELTEKLFSTEESNETERIPLSEVLNYVDSRFSDSFSRGFEYDNLNTIGDLLNYPKRKCLKFPNIGKKALSNLEDILEQKYGINKWV